MGNDVGQGIYEVAGVLLTGAINSLQFADDSGGEIGYLIDQTIKR